MTDDVKLEEKTVVASEKEVKAVEKEVAEQKDDDSIKWRAKYKVTKEELETIKAQNDLEKKDLSSKVEATFKERQMYEEKYIDAEVKAHAVAAGIKDIEFVKLIDKGEIKLDDKGNLLGVDKAITDLKARKPDWFGSEKKLSSSNNAPFPEKGGAVPLDARSLSKEDWKKNRQKYMSGQM